MNKAKKLRNDCFALPQGVDWAPLDKALSHLEKSLTPIAEVEILPINQAIGRVLAGDLVAISNSPPFSNSAVDGYAFRCDPTDASEKKNSGFERGQVSSRAPIFWSNRIW